ncbi:MAG: carboxylesterase family protein [Pseudomonadota bacterium]
MKSVLSIASALFILALAIPIEAAVPAKRVTLDSGQADGIVLASGVEAYLGIPFAAPPVRELRWREPQTVAHWSGVLHADRFGPQCMQPQRALLTNQYSGSEITSEDCLYLNVWTTPGLKKAPVIVYLYGGGFFIGAANMPLYGGEGVARHGAVFVNLNYRLGPLGFIAHPELSAESPHKTSGNYAFMDQIAALQWIRRNIAQFGGDPEKVTIAGQSAGSMSVLALQASPLGKGLFHRAVGMSGAILGGPGPGMRTLADAEREGLKFQQVIGAKSLAEMRALPADRLGLPRTPGGPSIGPVQDGYVLPDDIAAIFARSRQNDVPLMLGFARDEALGGFGGVKDLADYQTKAATRFGARAAEFLQLYPASTDTEARTQARVADRDSTMAVSMNAWAQAQTRTGRAPVFSYEFSRPHSYVPGVKFPDLDPATAGAYHTSEVPFWLGTLDSFNTFRPTRNWTLADRDMSAAMTESLVAFARSGDPTTARLKWPRYELAGEALLEFADTARPSTWPERRKLDFFGAVPTAPVSPPSGARD